MAATMEKIAQTAGESFYRGELAQAMVAHSRKYDGGHTLADFEALGHTVSFEAQEALEGATVVIDCTPAGNENKKLYETLSGPLGFLAQGSEFGFGKMYAMGINDEALVPGEDRFLQIVSCNTHNIAALVKTLGEGGDGGVPRPGRTAAARRGRTGQVRWLRTWPTRCTSSCRRRCSSGSWLAPGDW